MKLLYNKNVSRKLENRYDVTTHIGRIESELLKLKPGDKQHLDKIIFMSTDLKGIIPNIAGLLLDHLQQLRSNGEWNGDKGWLDVAKPKRYKVIVAKIFALLKEFQISGQDKPDIYNFQYDTRIINNLGSTMSRQQDVRPNWEPPEQRVTPLRKPKTQAIGGVSPNFNPAPEDLWQYGAKVVGTNDHFGSVDDYNENTPVKGKVGEHFSVPVGVVREKANDVDEFDDLNINYDEAFKQYQSVMNDVKAIKSVARHEYLRKHDKSREAKRMAADDIYAEQQDAMIPIDESDINWKKGHIRDYEDLDKKGIDIVDKINDGSDYDEDDRKPSPVKTGGWKSKKYTSVTNNTPTRRIAVRKWNGPSSDKKRNPQTSIVAYAKQPYSNNMSNKKQRPNVRSGKKTNMPSPVRYKKNSPSPLKPLELYTPQVSQAKKERKRYKIKLPDGREVITKYLSAGAAPQVNDDYTVKGPIKWNWWGIEHYKPTNTR